MMLIEIFIQLKTKTKKNISQDFKKETSSAMSKALERHMENAQKLRANNDNNWWKIHEACLIAVSAMKPVFQELLANNALEFNLNAFVNQFVIACLHESSKCHHLLVYSIFLFSKYK